jgi:hypothetical protein
MKIVAVKIKSHWYRAASVLPVLCEYYPKFPVSRLRNETLQRLENVHGFSDVWKYGVYDMNRKQFINLEKPKDKKPF